jgi:hypothetical protein
MEEQTPKGGTLTMGALSIIVAAGVPVSTPFAGKTMRLDGAAPKLHWRRAPIQTIFAMIVAPSFS